MNCLCFIKNTKCDIFVSGIKARSMKKSQLVSILLLIIFLINSTATFSNRIEKPSKKKERPKVGLVLSGGGAKGFAYIGMLDLFNEVGLQVDYIGGTSIGSIVGGLYAVGYSPEAIKDIVVTQDWDALLRDEIPRKYLSYEEKEFMDKPIITLPIRERKIGLKQAMYHGQQINLLLNRYFSPAWSVTEFKNLQTPFLCVGANLFNGQAEVLTSGYLPYAIRSSMSIPGYFSPTYYNGMYLVDGGVVNNYPAKPVMDYGAGLLVGGDVQSGLKDTISELKTLAEIITQIVFFHAEEANLEADSLLKINVKYDVPATTMGFSDYDTIIKYGYCLADQYRDEIKALADSLNAIEPVAVKERNAKPLVYFDVVDIKYRGNHKIPDQFLENYFDKVRNSTATINEVEHLITSIYGTKFFEYVFYKVEPRSDGKFNLIIEVQESSPGYLGASVHYDSDYHGSVKVSGTFRNVFGNRSKLFTEVLLGTNPRLRALYLLSNGDDPGFGVEVDMYEFTFGDYEKGKKTTDLSIANFKSSAFYTTNFKNLYSFRAGFEYEYFRFKQKVVIYPDLVPLENFNSYGNIFVRFRADTRDKLHFSTTGFNTDLIGRYVMTLSSGWVQDVFSNSFILSLKTDQNISLSPKFVFRPGLYFGWTFQQDVITPVQYLFGAGGLNDINYINNYVPFTGVNFIQRLGLYSAIGRAKLQYNIYEKFYLTLRSDFGVLEDEVDEIFNIKNAMLGYGLTASYDSFIGPVELTVMGSNINPNVTLFLNVGFIF